MNEDPTVPLGSESLSRAAPPPLAAVWGGFQLLARGGTGGFGEVYRAWDPNLQREIALKLLLPGALDGEAEYQATLREARALASVKHPNIVSIYGCDRHNSRVGFWTDFIHGKTLASLLVTQSPFGYHEAALIGSEVARALSAVHRANLLHRDIKPENVMREDGGRILLMDFGLSALPQHTAQLAGTPNYMAPELFRCQPASVATDIYALGVLLYFLVSGKTPARLNGLTTAQAAEACAQRKPLVDLRSDLPEGFLRIVSRAIALDPDQRFRSAGEMAEALSTSLAAASGPHEIVQPLVSPPSIRIEGSDEKEKNYKKNKNPWVRRGIGALVLLFIFGNKLPLIGRFFTHHEIQNTDEPGRTVSPAIRNADETPDADELFDQAESLLGKSYKESNVLAATDKLNAIDPSDANYPAAQALLGSTYLLEFSRTQDQTTLQNAIARTQTAIKLNPLNVLPYVTLARIEALQKKNTLALQTAAKAISLDPADADAYCAQADVLESNTHHTEAIAAAQKATDIAPEDWRPPLTLGRLYASTGDGIKAAEMFHQSLKLADDNALAYFELALVESHSGQLESARDDLQHALAIDPEADVYEQLSRIDRETFAYNDSIIAGEKATELRPASYAAWYSLREAYRMVPADHQLSQEAYKKAIRLAEDTLKKEPSDARLIAALALLYARTGDTPRTSSLIRQALQLSPDDAEVDLQAGRAAEVIGDRARAISLVSKSIGPVYSLAEMARDPDLLSLRSDPRFPGHLSVNSPKPQT